MDFVIGGLAASGASLFSNPFDVLKTRMQLQGELKARGKHVVYYKNVFHAGYVVFKNEGIRGLQKGLSTALVLHGLRNSIRLGAYQWLNGHGLLTDPEGHTIFWRSAVGSALSGAAGAFVGSPLFLIKTQLQAQAPQQIAVGHQHGHDGPIRALVEIFKKNGIFGLWRGCNGTVLRAIVGSSAQLSIFAVTKDALQNQHVVFREHKVVTSFVASIIGGIFQTLAMTPFDLVSTRLYNQPVDSQGRGLLYKGIVDCFLKIGKKEGLLGFYKGVGALYMRLAPHGALCLVFWDGLKDLQIKYEKRSSLVAS